jgi:hypothetical protein
MDTSIPKPLAQIVYRTLAKEPSARYRNASQLAHILRDQLGPQPEPEPEPNREKSLIVPPPPAPVSGDTWSSTDLYDLEGDKAWGEPSEGVDWVLIALLVAAAIAVLGLIPLWTAVYDRYASATIGWVQFQDRTDALPAPSLIGGDGVGGPSNRGAELDGRAIVWYNAVLSKVPLARGQAKSPPQIMEQASSFGVELTGQRRKM